MEIDKAQGSACIEMLFSDQTDDFAQRIHLAHQAGYAAVEFWLWSNKDLDAVATALKETGLSVAGFVAEPMVSLNDPTLHDRFLAALPASIAVAQRLGARFLYIQGGSTLPDVSRAHQTLALTDLLRRAADVLHGSGVTLLLEPVSDARNGFLTHAADGLSIIAAVNRPEIRLLLDIFHCAVAAEDFRAAVGRHTNLIGHVHVADHPGRGSPGTGTQDLAADLAWLRAQGYKDWFGMEHLP